MPKKTIHDVDVASKRVLVRVDFNVPLDGGEITDDRRLRAALPTVKSIIDRGGSAILMSHLGRPEGDGYDAAHSLKPVADRLAELLDRSVDFPSNDCVDDKAATAAKNMSGGDVILLENLRFHKGEKDGDPAFASKLAALADVYCNDAFGTCHRTDASMVAVPRAMEGKPRVIGHLVEKEIRFLQGALASPERPYAVVLGGAKVSDKIGVVRRLLGEADSVLVGGAMAYTFLKALGRRVGGSRVEEDRLRVAKELIEEAANLRADLYLPLDHVCSTRFAKIGGDVKVFDEQIEEGYIGLDIGPATQSKYTSIIREAKTIVWNGPMGVFEWGPFAIGTQQVARAIAEATANGATSIVGGGDTAAAAEQFAVAEKVSHVSTGGGASLAMLEGKPFVALDAIEDA